MASVSLSGGSNVNDFDPFRRRRLEADLIHLGGYDPSTLAELDLEGLEELKEETLRELMEGVA